jgi:hypothetical protein
MKNEDFSRQKNHTLLDNPLADLLMDYLISREGENVRQATLDTYRFMIIAFMRYMLDSEVGRVEDVTMLSSLLAP